MRISCDNEDKKGKKLVFGKGYKYNLKLKDKIHYLQHKK